MLLHLIGQILLHTIPRNYLEINRCNKLIGNILGVNYKNQFKTIVEELGVLPIYKTLLNGHYYKILTIQFINDQVMPINSSIIKFNYNSNKVTILDIKWDSYKGILVFEKYIIPDYKLYSDMLYQKHLLMYKPHNSELNIKLKDQLTLIYKIRKCIYINKVYLKKTYNIPIKIHIESKKIDKFYKNRNKFKKNKINDILSEYYEIKEN